MEKRIAQCNTCNREGVIGSGWSTRNKRKCLQCMLAESRSKPASSPIRKVSDKQKAKFRDDDELNAEIWKTRPHTCEECSEPLPKVPVKAFFSHLLSKGAHPELRHDPANIVLHCRDCHNKWEFLGGFREVSNTMRKHKGYIQARSML